MESLWTWSSKLIWEDQWSCWVYVDVLPRLLLYTLSRTDSNRIKVSLNLSSTFVGELISSKICLYKLIYFDTCKWRQSQDTIRRHIWIKALLINRQVYHRSTLSSTLNRFTRGNYGTCWPGRKSRSYPVCRLSRHQTIPTYVSILKHFESLSHCVGILQSISQNVIIIKQTFYISSLSSPRQTLRLHVG